MEKATAKYLESGADFIVAFGGGSPMDVPKAVGVVAQYGGSVTDYEGAHKVPGPIVPLIAIPTTAGTGSEVTAFSVITDHSRNYKLTVFSYEILPKYAILDAELITTAPASVAAACGIDAFIHAEEAYVSTAASPFSDALAEKAMALIGKNIRRFVANRNDIEAAEAMMTGSLFAGIAFSFARLGNVHAMSHPVSAFFDVPHGVANAVLLETRVNSKIASGVSPRGTLAFLRAVQGHALVQGRNYVVPEEDFKTVAVPVLAHRLTMQIGADDGRAAESVIEEILNRIDLPTENWSGR